MSRDTIQPRPQCLSSFLPSRVLHSQHNRSYSNLSNRSWPCHTCTHTFAIKVQSYILRVTATQPWHEYRAGPDIWRCICTSKRLRAVNMGRRVSQSSRAPELHVLACRGWGQFRLSASDMGHIPIKICSGVRRLRAPANAPDPYTPFKMHCHHLQNLESTT